MPKSNATRSLDLGKLLRIQAMVTQAVQVQITMRAANALISAYSKLRTEMLKAFQPDGLADHRSEFEGLFPEIGSSRSAGARLLREAVEAQVALRLLQGWIQGLIDELTFEQRMRLEAEARAAQANKPMGFST